MCRRAVCCKNRVGTAKGESETQVAHGLWLEWGEFVRDEGAKEKDAEKSERAQKDKRADAVRETKCIPHYCCAILVLEISANINRNHRKSDPSAPVAGMFLFVFFAPFYRCTFRSIAHTHTRAAHTHRTHTHTFMHLLASPCTSANVPGGHREHAAPGLSPLLPLTYV
jgi:hypothetical protein